MSTLPEHADHVQTLHDTVAALVYFEKRPAPAHVQTRVGIGLENGLAALLIWNLLVAFVVHFGAHVLGHTTCEALERNRARLTAGDRKAIGETKVLLTEALRPELALPPGEQDRRVAVAILTKILVKSGRDKKIAGDQAERVVDFLVDHTNGPKPP